MSSTIPLCNFPDIDTQYWQLDNKDWVKARKQEWLTIEPMLLGTANKSKKAVTIIKRYFLKGVMPDFRQLRSWDNYERHLDLFTFLWLHPSWDEATLTSLRHTYVHSTLISKDDVSAGFSLLFRSSDSISHIDWQGGDEDPSFIVSSGGYNELLFKIIMGDLTIEHWPEYRKSRRPKTKPVTDILSLLCISNCLCDKYKTTISSDYLYQYEQPLEWWYLSSLKDLGFYREERLDVNLKYLSLALYRIYHFDLEEGDTPRTRFAIKIQKILNERKFDPSIEQLWLDVKAGKVVHKNAWDD